MEDGSWGGAAGSREEDFVGRSRPLTLSIGNSSKLGLAMEAGVGLE